MDVTAPPPALRVNGELLRRHFKQTVSIIGKVESVTDSKIVITSSDNRSVTLNILEPKCIPREALAQALYLEAVGEASGFDQVTLHHKDFHWIVPLGRDLDLQVVNATTVMTHHPQMRQYFLPALPVD